MFALVVFVLNYHSSERVQVRSKSTQSGREAVVFHLGCMLELQGSSFVLKTHSLSCGAGLKIENSAQHDMPCGNYGDEENLISSLLDFARPDATPVVEWYNPPDVYTLGGQPCHSLPEAIEAAFHHQDVVAELEHLGAAGHPVANHVWELGSCPWNNMPGVCQLGDLPTDCRPLTSIADQMNDPCAIC